MVTVRLLLILLFISVIVASCGSNEPIQNANEETTPVADSTNSIRIKPLSTEKTHEGGVNLEKLNSKQSAD